MYLAAARKLTRRDHVLVVAIAVGVLAMNAYWIVVALRFWPYILDSAYFGQTGLGFLVADFAESLGPKTESNWCVAYPL